jgi:hypothetical protein
MFKRRDFIKLISVMGGVALTPFRGHGTFHGLSAGMDADQVEGELYAGFVLLPEGAPKPIFVQDEQYGLPNFCGAFDEGRLGKITGFYSPQNTLTDLTNKVEHPIYALSNAPDGLRYSGAGLVVHENGSVICGDITYEAFDPQVDIWYTAVSVWFNLDHPRPVPLWQEGNAGQKDLNGSLEKVDFLPGGGGVMVQTPLGFSWHWVMQDVYYSLNADLPSYQNKKQLQESLAHGLTLHS